MNDVVFALLFCMIEYLLNIWLLGRYLFTYNAYLHKAEER
jgi:hypothetical protein